MTSKINPKISVIVPYFKAEEYILKCAESLFKQTLDEIEYIFVNDCSPDNSFLELQKAIIAYPHRQDMVKLLNHKENLGVANARNTGIANASGEYITFCDSDDWVDTNMYEDMYHHALYAKSQIVWCDFVKEYSDASIPINQDCTQTVEECIKAILCSNGLSSYLCDKLIKRTLFLDHDLHFPKGVNIREDFLMIIKLFYHADQVSYLPKAYYHYWQRHDSISHNEDKFDESPHYIHNRIRATELISEFLAKSGSGDLYIKEVMCCKLILKRLILSNSNDTHKWINLFPETNRYILGTNLSLGAKLWLIAASKNYLGAVRFLKWVSKLKNK